MTLRIKQNFNDKRLGKIYLDASRKEWHDQMKRVNRQRLQPLKSGWSIKNRPNILTKSKNTPNGINTQFQVIDREPGKPIFKWVHITGTKRHIIRATKPHGLLVFPINNRTVFTKKPVNHPGFKPTGKVDEIFKEEIPKIREAVRVAGRNAVNRA